MEGDFRLGEASGVSCAPAGLQAACSIDVTFGSEGARRMQVSSQRRGGPRARPRGAGP